MLETAQNAAMHIQPEGILCTEPLHNWSSFYRNTFNLKYAQIQL